MAIFNEHEVFAAYMKAVEFTDFGEDGQPEHGAEFAESAKNEALKQCAEFVTMCANFGLLDEYIRKGGNAEQFGHDFWLTRNRHGVGFWDRNLGGLGEQLTTHARKFGELSAYTGGDSLVYFG
jgi:hypothetical protein